MRSNAGRFSKYRSMLERTRAAKTVCTCAKTRAANITRAAACWSYVSIRGADRPGRMRHVGHVGDGQVGASGTDVVGGGVACAREAPEGVADVAPLEGGIPPGFRTPAGPLLFGSASLPLDGILTLSLPSFKVLERPDI